MNAKIRVNDICSGYEKVPILENLSIEIPTNKITILVGPNGCGKSTLLKTIGRILLPSKGQIQIDEYDVLNTPSMELAKKLSILPQMPNAPEGLCIEELVGYGRHPYQSRFGHASKEDQEIIEWAMKVTGVYNIRHKSLDALSGGQKQRAFIALCLAQKTDTIMLDEPTTFLDISYQLEILNLLQELNRKYGTTIVMVLHDMNQAARFADYIIAMKDGKIIKSGTPKEVIETETLRCIYDIKAKIMYDEQEDYPICISYDLCH